MINEIDTGYKEREGIVWQMRSQFFLDRNMKKKKKRVELWQQHGVFQNKYLARKENT